MVIAPGSIGIQRAADFLWALHFHEVTRAKSSGCLPHVQVGGSESELTVVQICSKLA